MPPIVAIGASQGGVEALNTIISGLGSDFPSPILVVLHIGASPSILPSILSEADGMPACFASSGDKIRPGHIFVAPPDHHLLVNDGVLELSHGPRENWARPAIDPLFRSLALYHGPDVIGIILSGQLNDGTAGLYEIKRQGGIAIVQTPSSAQAASMPSSALENIAIDYCLPVAEMPRLLKRLVLETGKAKHPSRRGLTVMEQTLKTERPTALTCPECGGAAREQSMESITQFRCHIGHVMTAEIFASAQIDVLENTLCEIRRMLNERSSLCRSIAEKHFAKGNKQAGEYWMRAAEEAAGRMKLVEPLIDAEWTHPETA